MAVGLDPLMTEKKRMKFYGRMVIQKGLDGSVIKQHGSLSEASRLFANSKAALKAIWRVLEGQRKSYKGFYWEYGPQERLTA